MSQQIGYVTEWHSVWPVITQTGNCAPPPIVNGQITGGAALWHHLVWQVFQQRPAESPNYLFLLSKTLQKTILRLWPRDDDCNDPSSGYDRHSPDSDRSSRQQSLPSSSSSSQSTPFPTHPHSAHHEYLNHHERAEDEDAAVVDIADPRPGDIAISVDTFTNIVSFFFPESNFPGPIFIVQLNSSETEIFWITFWNSWRRGWRWGRFNSDSSSSEGVTRPFRRLVIMLVLRVQLIPKTRMIPGEEPCVSRTNYISELFVPCSFLEPNIISNDHDQRPDIIQLFNVD